MIRLSRPLLLSDPVLISRRYYEVFVSDGVKTRRLIVSAPQAVGLLGGEEAPAPEDFVAAAVAAEIERGGVQALPDTLLLDGGARVWPVPLRTDDGAGYLVEEAGGRASVQAGGAGE